HDILTRHTSYLDYYSFHIYKWRCRCVRFPFYMPAALYCLSLHDALPISPSAPRRWPSTGSIRETSAPGSTTTRTSGPSSSRRSRSEEHTSELQSRENLVCRLLLEKKNIVRRGEFNNRFLDRKSTRLNSSH